MQITSDLIKDYEDRNLLQVNLTGPCGMTLLKYSRNCFHSFDWDDFTMRCRGLVIDEEGNPLNNPFIKMFNLDEHPDYTMDSLVGRMRNEPYEILDKSNGHLCILFCYGGKWFNVTSGSFDGDFCKPDRKVLEDNGVLDYLETHPAWENCTFMFEMIVDYDKHTCYKRQTDLYGHNVPVLIGMRSNKIDRDYSWDAMNVVATVGGFPVVRNHKRARDIIYGTWSEDVFINGLYDVKGIEGYIIKFQDGTRYKIKTKEYLFARYMKEISSEGKMKKLFIHHFLDEDAAKADIPEEYHHLWDRMKSHYDNFSDTLNQVFMGKLNYIRANTSGDTRESLLSISNKDEKAALLSMLNHGKLGLQYVKGRFIESHNFDYSGYVNG